MLGSLSAPLPALVPPGAPVEIVVSAATGKGVVFAFSEKPIWSIPTSETVVARAAAQFVTSPTAVNSAASAIRQDHIVASASLEEIIARAAFDVI